ncbi:hypothetical protein AB0J80_19285 [Actinoplanes sp. NPDC049548]
MSRWLWVVPASAEQPTAEEDFNGTLTQFKATQGGTKEQGGYCEVEQ